jgi:hypothetical protein
MTCLAAQHMQGMVYLQSTSKQGARITGLCCAATNSTSWKQQPLHRGSLTNAGMLVAMQEFKAVLEKYFDARHT